MRRRQHDTIQRASSTRAIYIDFECLKTKPHSTPKLLGITTGDSEAVDQLLVDPALSDASRANRRCSVVDLGTAVREPVERGESEERLIVGWSLFDGDVAKRANPELADRIDALHRNAIHTARPWRQGIHPSFRIQPEDEYAPTHTLDKYAVLARYRGAGMLADATPARWLRHLQQQLNARGRYWGITAETKRDWHDLLEYNRHDCLPLRGSAAELISCAVTPAVHA